MFGTDPRGSQRKIDEISAKVKVVYRPLQCTRVTLGGVGVHWRAVGATMLVDLPGTSQKLHIAFSPSRPPTIAYTHKFAQHAFTLLIGVAAYRRARRRNSRRKLVGRCRVPQSVICRWSPPISTYFVVYAYPPCRTITFMPAKLAARASLLAPRQ